MTLHVSSVLKARPHGGGSFSVRSINLHDSGSVVSPISMVDDFRVSGRPFAPHPHAGFSAVTYIFRDSVGGLRSRDSMGNDITVGAGGIVWTQAGSGVIHHEVPSNPGRELHGVQFFVNLSAKNKLIPPQVMALDGDHVAEWTNAKGDVVRVVVGSHEGVSSPVVPADPFTLLDADLHDAISLELTAGQFGVIYVASGEILIVPEEGKPVAVGHEHAATLRGTGRFTLQAKPAATLLFFCGIENHDPLLAHGPFMMNSAEQINAAIARYQAGQMGHLAPL